MPEKLDPHLLELVQRADAGLTDSAATVDVLVALDAPLDSAMRRDLTVRGVDAALRDRHGAERLD